MNKRTRSSRGPAEEQTLTSSADEEPVRRNPRDISIPLYVAACIGQIAGLTAVAYQLAEPTFAYFTIFLTIIGMCVSYQLRRIGTHPRLIKTGTILLGLVFFNAMRGMGVFGTMVPTEVHGSQEMLLVSALAFTATFCSFLLLTDEAVVFTCVWSIAIIGLTGTVNINRELILCFAVFLAAATFLLVHQNALAQSQGSRSSERRPAATSWPLLKTQIVMSGVAWVASIILGFLIAIPVQMVGRNLSLATIIQRLKVPPSAATRSSSVPRLIFDSLGEFRVGLGPIDDDPSERMTVLSEKPQYWRGRVYDQYNGSGWVSTVAQQGEDIFPEPGQDTPDGLGTFNLKPYGPKRTKTTRYVHRFRVIGGVFGPLFHAAEPVIARAPVGRIIQRTDNSIGAGRGGGGEYEIESDVSEPKPTELRNTSTEYPDEIRDRYLLVGQSNDELQKLAVEAIQDTPNNPYDKAQSIRRFIANRCVYTREARAVPRGRDAAEFFLNDTKEGYCDLYATSLTILCRYAGIPARVATGYAPGTPSEDARAAADPKDKRTSYVLRGSDQHAWTEVYFNDYGWIVFDATQDTSGTVTPPQTPQPVKKPDNLQSLLQNGKLSLILTGLGVLGFLYVLVNELFLRGGGGKRAKHDPAQARANEIARLYRKTIHRIERKGILRLETMTPSEYVPLVRERLDDPTADALGKLTALLEQALYGPSTVTDADVNAARQASHAVGAAAGKAKVKREETGAISQS